MTTETDRKKTSQFIHGQLIRLDYYKKKESIIMILQTKVLKIDSIGESDEKSDSMDESDEDSENEDHMNDPDPDY